MLFSPASCSTLANNHVRRQQSQSSPIRSLPINGTTLVYLKFLIVWILVLLADFLLEFRFEYLWPFWLLLRSVYDSFKYQGLVSSAAATALVTASATASHARGVVVERCCETSSRTLSRNIVA